MKNIQKAVFGGGCFWGVEKFLQEIPGVIDAVSGYAGGSFIDPSYSDVCGGRTGHAEVVNVEFNANQINYEDLLNMFLKKYGTTSDSNKTSTSQYRSIVLYQDLAQKDIIDKVFEGYKNNRKNLTTQSTKLEHFYPAEDYHQDYYGSCRINE